MQVRVSVSFVALALLAGCATGPDYKKPQQDVPAAWSHAAPDAPAITLDQWWQRLNDPVLNGLVDTALASNQDLRIALTRVEAARAGQRSARADKLPTVIGNAGASRNRSSEFAEPAMPTLTSNSLRLNIDLSYEIDLWGRLKRADEAATARLLASEANRDAIRHMLIADVVRTYVELRALDAQLLVAEQALKAREEEVALQKRRFAGGITSQLDVNQAEIELNATRIAIPELKQAIALQENALATLLGQAPGPQPRGKTLQELGQLPAVPAGLPSELLQRRPDLRAAEQELIAANADIGYAKASYYPRLSLTGLLGLESGELSNLLKTGATTWNLGTNLATPLVTGGKSEAAQAVARANYAAAEANWRKAVLNALREVEDALVQQGSAREIQQAREAQLTAMEQTLKLARLRYTNGYSGYLDVLTTQRALFQTQLGVIDSQRARLAALVGLYKALGGGWQAQ